MSDPNNIVGAVGFLGFLVGTPLGIHCGRHGLRTRELWLSLALGFGIATGLFRSPLGPLLMALAAGSIWFVLGVEVGRATSRGARRRAPHEASAEANETRPASVPTVSTAPTGPAALSVSAPAETPQPCPYCGMRVRFSDMGECPSCRHFVNLPDSP
jgi:hypothetical protein